MRRPLSSTALPSSDPRRQIFAHGHLGRASAVAVADGRIDVCAYRPSPRCRRSRSRSGAPLPADAPCLTVSRVSAGVPPSGARNCNDSQRIALTVFAALAALFALAQPFLKTFLRDASGRHIVYPPPSGVAVADTVDAGVVFPYRTERRHVVWPAVRAAPDGRLALVRDGQYIKVLVLDKSCTFRVRTQSRFSRILARILPPVRVLDSPPYRTATNAARRSTPSS